VSRCCLCRFGTFTSTRPTSPDRKAEIQRDHEQDISRLDERVAAIERDYADANQKVASGDRTATAALREEVKEDVANVKKAVTDLRTTTPENWWDRNEAAMKQTADDIEADVSRLAGKVTSPHTPATKTPATREHRAVHVATGQVPCRPARANGRHGTRIGRCQSQGCAAD
jgi:hypothetical protein